MESGTSFKRKRHRRIRFLVLVLLLFVCAFGAAFGFFLLSAEKEGQNVSIVQKEDYKDTVQSEPKKEQTAEEKEQMAEEKERIAEEKEQMVEEKEQIAEEKEQIIVQDIGFECITDNRIQIVWTVDQPQYVKQYVVMKRSSIPSEEWQEAGIVIPDASDNEVCFVDKLESDEPQQFEYRVDVCVMDTGAAVGKGASILASNMKICIDPGHYQGINRALSEPSYGYAEGDFTLLLAQALSDCLKEDYGIDTCLTRTEGSITLGGYTDDELDSGHLSLRGEYAAENGCDLFLSLHTNANNDDANGCDTYLQPLGINKTIVIANAAACSSLQCIEAGNAIGKKVTAVNYELGLSDTDEFQAVSPDQIEQWTDQYNDSLDTKGTVVCRMNGSTDYYGVLRGAAAYGVPGLIIEHGFHTVPEVRQQAMEGDLKEKWARADADGIAEAYDFLKITQFEKGRNDED